MATLEEIEAEIARREAIEAEIAKRQAGAPSPSIPSQLPPEVQQQVSDGVAAKSAGMFTAPPQVDPRLAQAMGGGLGGQPLPEGRAPTPEELARSQSALEAAAIGAGRGFTTLGRAVGLVEPETSFERQAFQQLEQASPVATTVGEVAGESAPFLVPGLGVATLPGRALQVAGTAALGATEAGLITRGRGDDVGKQLFAAGLGGSIAGALELALPVIGRIGGKIFRRVTGKAPSGAVIDSAGNPSKEFADALAESGQSIDDIVKEAKDELTQKAVNPREAARKAFLESQGLDPTRAQVTRNAADFQAQQEAAKTSGAVRDALEKQDALLTTRFNNKVLETGGQSANQSVSVFDFITEKATVLDQEISDLYRAARTTMPADKNINFERLTKKLRDLYPADRRSGGNISAIIGDMQSKMILNKNRKLTGRVNVDVAEDLRKYMNELYDEKNPYANGLLRQLKDALDDDVFSAAGKDYFKQGRQAKAAFEKELNRSKVSKFDSRKNNLVRDILENKIDPDRIADKVIFGKTWRPDDLMQLKNYLSTDDAGKAAFDDLRAESMQRIKESAFIGAPDEKGFQALSRDKLERALKTIGDKKRSVLFTPQENKFLNDILEVAKIREPVRSTAIGRGPSAQAISRLEKSLGFIEERMRKLPMMNEAFDFIGVDSKGTIALKAKPTPIKQPRQPIDITPVRATIPAAVATTQQEQQ